MNISTDICVLLDTPITFDSRVQRHAETLARAGWKVMVLSVSTQNPTYSQYELRGFNVVEVPVSVTPLARMWDAAMKVLTYLLVILMTPLPQRFLLWRWLRWVFFGTSRAWLTRYRVMNHAVRTIEARFYHANDYLSLVVPRMAGIPQHKVVYDSHELFFDQFRPPTVSKFALVLTDGKRAIERTIERDLCQHSAAVLTVSDRIADHMAEKLQIPRPIVVRNLVDVREIGEPALVYPTDKRRTIVHTGNLNPGRCLDKLIVAVSRLPDDVALVLMGKGWLYDLLLEQAESLGISHRVFIVPPAPPPQIVATMTQADAAAILNPKRGLNRDLTFPQKFFEAIAAGLPMVTGQTTSIMDIMNEFELGLTVDPESPHQIADAFEQLLDPDEYNRYRQNVLHARQILNWEQEEQRLIRLYKQLLT